MFYLKRENVQMVTTIFVEVDNFCKYFEDKFNKKLLCKGEKRFRRSRMAASEVMTIMTVFIRHSCLGKCTGISVIDSCPIRSTHAKRRHSSEIMKNFGAKEKTRTS